MPWQDAPVVDETTPRWAEAPTVDSTTDNAADEPDVDPLDAAMQALDAENSVSRTVPLGARSLARRRQLERREQFDEAVDAQFAAEQERLGRDLNDDEQRVIVGGLLKEGEVPLGGFLGWLLRWSPAHGSSIDEVDGFYRRRRFFELAPEDVARFVPPREEREEIKRSLQQHGLPVTTRTVAALFASVHGLPSAEDARTLLVQQIAEQFMAAEQEAAEQEAARRQRIYDERPPEVPLE